MISEIFEQLISKHNFVFAIDSGLSQPLSFCNKFLNRLYIVEIVKNWKFQRYYLKYEIYCVKSYQFTFDINFNIKSNQKSKFLKLESDICSTIEKSLLNTTNLFGD